MLKYSRPELKARASLPRQRGAAPRPPRAHPAAAQGSALAGPPCATRSQLPRQTYEQPLLLPPPLLLLLLLVVVVVVVVVLLLLLLLAWPPRSALRSSQQPP